MNAFFKQISSPGRFFLLLGVSFLTIIGYGAQRVLVPVQMNQYEDSALLIGFYLSLFGLPRALMNVGGGMLTDRFSKKWNIILGLLLSSVVANFALSFTQSGAAAGFWRMVIGVGLAWSTTAILAAMADISAPSIRGSVFGLQKVAFWSGITLATLLAPLFLTLFSYREIMLSGTSLGILGVILVIFFYQGSRKASAVSNRLAESRPQPAAGKREKTILHYTGLMTKVIEDGVVTAYLPLLLVANMAPPAIIGVALTCYTATFAVSQPAGGMLSDKLGRWPIILAGNLMMTAGAGLLLFFYFLPAVYGAAVLMGIGAGFVAAVAETRISILSEGNKSGTTLGWWRLSRDMGSFVGPLLMGLLVWIGGLGAFVGCILVLMGLSTLFSLPPALKERWKPMSRIHISPDSAPSQTRHKHPP